MLKLACSAGILNVACCSYILQMVNNEDTDKTVQAGLLFCCFHATKSCMYYKVARDRIGLFFTVHFEKSPRLQQSGKTVWKMKTNLDQGKFKSGNFSQGNLEELKKRQGIKN